MYREKKTVLPAFRTRTSRLRILPTFVIISVERAGTTSLYRYLCQHPCAGEALRKEVHYFDMNASRGPDWYRAHFPTRVQAAWVRLRRGHRLITGEASPYYLYHPHVPARLAKLLPDVRLIALVRNPVERAYSHHQMNVRQEKEDLSFEEAIEREEERLRGEWEKLVADPSHWSDRHYKYGYLSRGLYADRLEEWGKHFPRDRVLVVCSEDLYADPAGTVARVASHLELPPFALRGFKAYNQKPYPGIDGETRRRLVAFFEPHNQRLYEYLGRDLGWT
jgi:hypothetical protein